MKQPKLIKAQTIEQNILVSKSALTPLKNVRPISKVSSYNKSKETNEQITSRITLENVDDVLEEENKDEDLTSIDLTEYEENQLKLSEEEVLTILADKHRFQDIGKIVHIGIIDFLTTYTC